MFRLLPKEDKYFDLFNRVASNITGAAQLLQQLFNDFERRAAYADQIKQLEHACDDLTHDIVKRLNQTFITPFDREDIHALASSLDDVLDDMDSVARRVILYKLGDATEDTRKMADVLTRIAASMERAVLALEKDSETVMKECIVIHSLENEGDTYHHDAVDRLFSHEKDPIQILKLKEIYEKMERCIDKAEDVANVLEAIVLKNA
jgi:predicted phosphate transport protein (TIGR00153 family)